MSNETPDIRPMLEQGAAAMKQAADNMPALLATGIAEVQRQSESAGQQLAEAIRRALLPPLAVRVGLEWDAHIDAMRLRSYELSVQRGHMRRG